MAWRAFRTVPYLSLAAIQFLAAALLATGHEPFRTGMLTVLLLGAWAILSSTVWSLTGRLPGWPARLWVGGFLILILSTLVTQWPLRAAFAVSRPAIKDVASRVAAGRPLTTPTRVGCFLIRRADFSRGVLCLWTDPDSSGPSGLAQCTPAQADRFNLWSKISLGPDWQMVFED